ncbi:MAG: sensor domain-containing diguanylate cyclase [Spirochaetales bacterium]|nr:MAG: sensor domain-containing diguanylate cyclase [Spirochaetales bacterium]
MLKENQDQVTIRSDVLSRIGVFYRDLRRGSGFANKNWMEMGHSYEDLSRDAWLERVHPKDRGRVSEQFSRHMRGETQEFHCEYRVRAADGSWRWLMSAGMVEERDKDGTPLVYVGHDTDITNFNDLRDALETARHQAEEHAMEAEALRGAGAVVVSSLDAPTAVRSVVEQLKLLVPFKTAMVCEMDNRELRLVGGSGVSPDEDWKTLVSRQTKVMLASLRAKGPSLVDDGDRHQLFMPLITRGNSVGVLILEREGKSFSGEPVRITMYMADYLALALSNARLYSRMQQRAEIDQLSGLLTRRAFMETGESIVDESFHSGRRLTCLLLDIDKFKSINDTYGHPTGDQVIRALGGMMRETLRGSDLIARYGGEEFCALLPETSVDHAVEVADRLRANVEKCEFTGVEGRITVSIGLAGIDHPPSGEPGTTDRLSIEQMLKRADRSLYQAKQTGRNKVVRFAGP